MTTTLLIITIILLLVVVGLLVVALLRKPTVNLSPIQQGNEKTGDCTERAIREEVSKAAQAFRQEMSIVLKNAGDTLNRNFAALTEASSADAKALREEVVANLQRINDLLVKTIEELTNLHKEPLDVFSKRLDKLTLTDKQTLDEMQGTIETRLVLIQEENGKQLDQVRQESTASVQKAMEAVGKIITDFVNWQREQFATVMEQVKGLTEANDKRITEVKERPRSIQNDKGENLEQMRPTVEKEPQGTLQKWVVKGQEQGNGGAEKSNYNPQVENRIKKVIKRRGGRVTVDKGHPEKRVVGVDLAGTQVTDAELEQLKGLTNLQSLNLGETQVTEAGLEHLKDFTNLRSLVLVHTQVSEAGIIHLRGLTNLTQLDLGNTPVTDADLEQLKGLMNLQWVSLWNTRVADTGLKHLRGLTQLDWLDLANTKVTDAGLEHLKGLNNLQSLDLGNTQVTDAGLQHLKGLTQLHTLDLVRTQVTDAGLEHLKGLADLQTLDLSGTKVTDAGLEYLKALTNRHTLCLGSTAASDAGLEHLTGLARLRWLRMNGTQVTDAGLEYLKALTNLERLDMRGTNVSDEGVSNFRQTLPHCIIRHGDVPSQSQIPASSTSHPRRHSFPDATTEKARDKAEDATAVGQHAIQEPKDGLRQTTPNAPMNSVEDRPTTQSTLPTEANEQMLVAIGESAEKPFGTLQEANGNRPNPIQQESIASVQLIGEDVNKVVEELRKVIETLGGALHVSERPEGPVIGVYLSNTKVNDDTLAHLKGVTSLQWLNLAKTKITDDGLAYLKGLTSLQWLNLGMNHQITDDGLAYLDGLTNLQWLNLRKTQVTDDGLACLEGLTNLQWLNLLDTQVTDKGVKRFQKVSPNVAIVGIEKDCQRRESDGIRPEDGCLTKQFTTPTEANEEKPVAVEEMTETPFDPLQEEEENGMKPDLIPPESTSSALPIRETFDKVVGKLRKVVEELFGTLIVYDSPEGPVIRINLRGTKATDTTLANFEGLTNLQSLDLARTQVTDTGLAHIEGLTNLQSLDLGKTRATDTGLAQLQKLIQLKWLSLWNTNVADTGLSHLRVLTQLQRLTLAGTQVPDAGLEHLEDLTNLQLLDLGQTLVTDAGLEHLNKLTNLQTLDLRNTQVTDAGLEYVKGLTNLRSLILVDTQVTDKGVKKFQEALPTCTLHFRHVSFRSHVPIQIILAQGVSGAIARKPPKVK
jgi:Leucine-rich repeat (LRR) protein